jgi:hypothetical protein
MGLMDKVKAQADQAMVKAQQGLAQGQSKLDALQAKRAADALLRELGAAVHALHRGAGSQHDVDQAIAKVDAHVAEHGPITDGPDPT